MRSVAREEKRKKYYEADQEKLQKKLDEIGSGTYFKPKEGKNQIRILPPWNIEGLWYYEAAIHYGLTNEQGSERAYPCLKMFGKDCPVCSQREELLQGDKEDKKFADRIRPKTKYYTNILDRKTGKIMIWGFSAKTLGILLSYAADQDYGDISHPKEGFDVIVERTGTTRTDTKYQIRCRPKPSEVEEMDDLDLFKLDEVVVKEMEEDELQEIVDANFGESKLKKKNEDEEESPRKKKSKSDEDENEEEEPEIEKGDIVKFEEDGDELEGKVISINQKKQRATIEVDGDTIDVDGEEYKVDLDDLEKVEKKKKKKGKDEDDEDDGDED